MWVWQEFPNKREKMEKNSRMELNHCKVFNREAITIDSDLCKLVLGCLLGGITVFYEVTQIGPATRCYAIHLRWDVPKVLRYIRHAMCCDAFSNMLEFLHPILEYLSHLSSDGLQHCDGYVMNYCVVCQWYVS